MQPTAALALAAHPELNAGIDGDELVVFAEVSAGIAVDTPRGLVVPVIRDAGSLDLAGIAASSGSACASLTQTTSHVLRAIGCPPEEAEGSLCFTLGRWSIAADVDAVLDRLPPIVARLRALSAPLHT